MKTDRFLSIADILIVVSCIILALAMMSVNHRIDKIESSYVTQEKLDSVLTEIFD